MMSFFRWRLDAPIRGRRVWETLARLASGARQHRVLVSVLAWLLLVGVVALWTQGHYHAASGTIWLGKTIRVAVIAAWLLVAREWFVLRWELPQDGKQKDVTHHD